MHALPRPAPEAAGGDQACTGAGSAPLYARQHAARAAGRPLRLGSTPPIRWLRDGLATWLLPLSDGRFLVTGALHGPWRPGRWGLTALFVIAVAVAVGAWPITRRLTRRLERLKTGVDRLGEGDLAARVKVEGKDEVAALAASFNRSASRIEELVRSHKMLLANASHELRTPLTRINMALALSETDRSGARSSRADIDELDQLIEEILLASRLDAIRAPSRSGRSTCSPLRRRSRPRRRRGRGRERRGARRAHAAAPDGPQPDRLMRAATAATPRPT